MKRAKAKSSARVPAATARTVRRAPFGRFAVVLLLVGVAAAVLFSWRGRRALPVGSPSLDASGLDATSMLDSTRARFNAHDWVGGLAWAHEMNVAYPGTANYLIIEALAWHNYAREGVELAGGHPATRTSLDRIECEKRAFALLDSAASVAPDSIIRANISHWRGSQYELLGFSMDAYAAYDAGLKLVPGHPDLLKRAAWLQRVLIRPGDPKSVTPADAAPHP